MSEIPLQADVTHLFFLVFSLVFCGKPNKETQNQFSFVPSGAIASVLKKLRDSWPQLCLLVYNTYYHSKPQGYHSTGLLFNEVTLTSWHSSKVGNFQNTPTHSNNFQHSQKLRKTFQTIFKKRPKHSRKKIKETLAQKYQIIPNKSNKNNSFIKKQQKTFQKNAKNKSFQQPTTYQTHIRINMNMKCLECVWMIVWHQNMI